MYGDSCLIPLRFDKTANGASVSADGVKLDFKGSVLGINGSECDYSLSVVDSNILILRGSLSCADMSDIGDVEWFQGAWNLFDEMVVSSTELQDNFLFFRSGEVSFFLSLDFPCSRIMDGCIAYHACCRVEAGGVYGAESLSIGAVRLSGDKVGLFDRSEIEGVCEYVEKRFPNRFDRPVNSMACITNRMTDVREGRIFYSMSDNPTIYLDPEAIKEEIRLCADLGIEYYQLFEGKYDWPDEKACDAALKEIMTLAREVGVRVGDYVHPGELYCPHYNYEHRKLDRPEWRRLNSDGSRSELCFGNDEFVDFITGDLVTHNEKYGEELIVLDMLSVLPCADEGHGHESGGLYSQIKGLCRFTSALSDVSPDFLVWTNSGNWLQFMPKLLWYNPNVYLSDPHPREYGPALNMLKFYDDARREQMVTVHNRYFVPYRYYTNCEYYFSRHSRVDDLRYFEYGILQGLAVNPNICFGELRVFLDAVSHSRHESCKAFIRKWIRFIKENFSLWKHTLQVGDSPGVNANEIYAHISGDRGFLCFVNQDIHSKQSTVSLDHRIGLTSGERFTLREIYPLECGCPEGTLPFSAHGDLVSFRISPVSVRIIEVMPYVPNAEGLTVLGLPAVVEKTAEGYEITLDAPQGKTCDIGLIFPEGVGITGYSVETIKTVKMYTFPSQCVLLESHGNTARLRIVFPREGADGELSSWSADGGPLKHLPSCRSEFLGGYVHNLFSEEHKVILRVKTSGLALSKVEDVPDSVRDSAHPASLAEGKTQAFVIPVSHAEGGGQASEISSTFITGRARVHETSFFLPFIEWPSTSMAYGRDEIVELAFADASAVRSISCRVNGSPVEVCRYPYPANPKFCSFYIELIHAVTSGTVVNIRLEVEWLERAGRSMA